MTPSDPSTKLPPWIFIVTDLAFISAAIAIGAFQPRPFSSGTMIAIVGCLLAGAIVLFYPIVAHYERVKNEALDDRQRALEALARTLTSSAEQISIAANGLHEVAELAQKNLRQAEHLPQKLSERIAEFEARLAASNDAEKEELEKELVALRTSESERLDSVSDKISKSAADWAKLEASTQKNLAASRETIERAATDAVAQLTASLPAALATASAAASQSIAAAAASAERSLAELQSAAAAKHAAALAEAQTRAAAALDEKIAALSASLTTATTDALSKIDTALAASATRLEAAVTEAVKSIPAAPPVAPVPPASSPAHEEITPAPVATAEPATALEAAATESPSVAPEAHAHPPKRPRKPRRTESAAEDTPAPAVVAESTPAPALEPAAAPAAITEEPPPIPVTAIPEIAPVAPGTAEPFGEPVSTAPAALAPAPEPTPLPEPAPTPVEAPPAPVEVTPAPSATEEVVPAPVLEPEPAATLAEPPPPADEPADEPSAEPESTVAEPEPEPEPAPRKRAAKKPESTPADDEPGLGLEIDDTPPPQAAEVAEHVLTSDGATRLIVTAYIGIGNRLFIRGEGPGLSWEKGVPLQFVSIGKWRWETPDATGPVSFKLYKNDTVECTALGTRSIEPAHQQEVMASF